MQSVATLPPASEEVLPTWDVPEAVALANTFGRADELPVALPVEEESRASPIPPSAVFCPTCQSACAPIDSFCGNCGYVFAPAESAASSSHPRRIHDRYEVQELLRDRAEVRRYRGLDHRYPDKPTPIIVVEMPNSAAAAANLDPGRLPPTEMEIVLDDAAVEAVLDGSVGNGTVRRQNEFLAAAWPGPAWERRVIENTDHPAMPRIIDFIPNQTDANGGSSQCLVLSTPTGRLLWDAWEDPSVSAHERFGWLVEIAQTLHSLHEAGAILEGLRPDIVVVTDEGHVALTELGDLLPLPLPENPPIHGYAYSAPELVLGIGRVDARADLYSFGAMLYALHLGRELTDLDFEAQGVPKPFIGRFPDAHPSLARIIMKTFVRDRKLRFPTEQACRIDPTGFTELMQTLRTAGRALANVRLDIAGWTNTGMVRSGNEDAFAWHQSTGSQHDDIGERAFIVLADGMGGHEAGEVASAMAVASLKRQLLDKLILSGSGSDVPVSAEAEEIPSIEALLDEALRTANREIYQTSLDPSKGLRGMGCTVEAVYVDGQHVVVGHVGDSRTYLYSGGRLRQLTSDHTLVNRLVELGQLTAEEAETHPRRNELQQAVGCRTEVDPAVCHASLKPGDCLVVCSDGLTGYADDEAIVEIIQHSAESAERCARRLINLVNLHGGADNCTVIVARAT